MLYADEVVTTSRGYLLHAAGKNIIFCLSYKDFHFIFNLCFDYFLFSNLFIGYKNLQATGHMSSTSTIKTSLWDQWWWFFLYPQEIFLYIYIYIYIWKQTLIKISTNVASHIPHKYVGYYCEGGWKYANEVVTTSSSYSLHAADKSIVLCECYKDFHFISNLCFSYFSFSNLLLGYNNNYLTLIILLNINHLLTHSERVSNTLI